MTGTWRIVWGVAARPCPGEVESGDQYLVRNLPGATLVAVVDGLGHAAEAAVVARTAVAALKEANDEPVDALMARVHHALHKSRGVVMSLARFDLQRGTMTWLGVGNVEGVLVAREGMESVPAYPGAGQGSSGGARVHPSGRESLLLRGGILGQQLPTLHSAEVALRPGDVIVLATDGIQSAFLLPHDPILGRPLHGPQCTPQRIAERILATHVRDTDDALVLVAKAHGSAP